MRQVNLIEEKCDLSELVRMLEARDEDVIYLAKEIEEMFDKDIFD